MAIGFSLFRLKWTNYRFKSLNALGIVGSFLLISTYQIIIIFGTSDLEKYFPYSAFFLNLNALAVSALIFIQKYSKSKDILHILSKYFLKGGAEINQDRDDELVKEIEIQQKDPNWKPSFEDLCDMVTISSVSEVKFMEALGDGWIYRFNKKSLCFQLGVKISLLIFAGIMLVANAVVIYFRDDKSKMGIIVSISVLLMDVFTFLLYHSNTIQSTLTMIFLIILNRILMISLGQKYWIYGYMILYLIYGIALVYMVTCEKFPLENDVVIKHSHLADLFKKPEGVEQKTTLSKSKILHSISDNLRKINDPRSYLAILSLFFLGLMLIVSYTDLKGVYLPVFTIQRAGQGDLVLKFWQIGLLCIAIVLSFYFFVALVRISIRKAKKLDVFGQQVKNNAIYTKLTDTFGELFIFQILFWVSCIFWGLLAGIVTSKPFLSTYIIFCSASIISFLRALIYLGLNDFQYQESVTKLNQWIDKHNSNVAALEIKKEQIQKEFLEGTLKLPQLNDQEDQGDQKEIIEKLIAQERDKNKQFKENWEKSLAENEQLRQMQESGMKQMEEQMKKEQTIKDQKKLKSQKLMQQMQEEKAERQRQSDLKRRATERTVQESLGNLSRTDTPSKPLQNEKYQEDEIYEGGGPSPSLDPTKEYLNYDLAMKQSDLMARIPFTRLMRVKDWRLEYSSIYKAFFAKALRPNDYQFFQSLFVFIQSMIGLTVGNMVSIRPGLGFICSLPPFYIGLSILIGTSVIYQVRTFSIRELVYWILLNLLYLTAGLVYFIVKYEVNTFTIDVSKRSETQHEASLFILLYVLVTPTLAHGVIIILKIIDQGLAGLDKVFKGFAVVFFLGVGGMIACCFLFVDWISGVIFIGALIVIAYITLQVYLFVKNDFFMARGWLITNLTLGLLVILVGAIVGVTSDKLSNYEGVSYSALTLLILLWVFALFKFALDAYYNQQKPVFYSAQIFPVYKFNPLTNRIEPHFGAVIAWGLGLALITLWAFFTNLHVSPTWLGCMISIGVTQLLVLTIVYLRSITLDSIEISEKYLNIDIVRSSWLAAKLQYVKAKGAFSRAGLSTYRRAWKKRSIMRQYFDLLMNRKIIEHKGSVSLTPEILKEVNMKGKSIEEVRSLVAKFADSKYDLSDLSDVSNLTFGLEKLVHETYMDETELVIQFMLTAIQNSMVIKDISQKEFINFINSKRDLLSALDISLVIPLGGSIDSRVKKLLDEVEQLEPNKKRVFKQVKMLYDSQKSNLQQQSQLQMEQDQAREDQRLKEAEQTKKEKERKLAELQALMDGQDGKNLNLDMDIDNMPDCRLKYKIIVERAKAGKGKFTDQQFKGDDSCLGKYSEVVKSLRYEFKRINDIAANNKSNFVIFENGVDCNDIKQGALGDCYFLSAIGVIGDKQTRDKFIFIDTDDEWERCGAFCVKFFDAGKEDIVIVDDFFPFYQGSDQFLFVHTPSGKELWPCVLEKAYAKRYGDYGRIDGGKISAALTDLTDGIPESFKIKTFDNPQLLWDNLVQRHKEKCPMGAGTPSHPDGDRARSETGIVQGHAYSILKVVEADSHKLIQLRNPHGEGEWTGDWSDDSQLWSKRMRNLVGFVQADDGAFWMDFNDFINEYEEIFVCRIYNSSTGWTEKTLDDKWEGEYTEGLPSAQNKGAKMEKNPQYSITVNQPGKGFIVLRLLERDEISSAFGKFICFLNIQANQNGKLIAQPSKTSNIGTIGPSKFAVQSTEVEFPQNQTYPYKFTMVVANMKHGKEGEGSFKVQVYSKDPKMTISKLN